MTDSLPVCIRIQYHSTCHLLMKCMFQKHCHTESDDSSLQRQQVPSHESRTQLTPNQKCYLWTQ
uniref:Uncharacterized protein n=1 Tax=Anguilla anguilla TaxID=7936 RepID=A0A0E9XLK3_ANGAN